MPERPAEAAVPRDDVLVVGGEQRAGLDRGGDQGRRLAADHVEVQLDRQGRRTRSSQMSMYWPSHSARHVSSYSRIRRRTLRVGEAELGQPVQRDPRQAEQRVAGVDRLRDAVERPQRRAVAALEVAVLDVVVDEAEVVAELDRGGARQRPLVFAGDRGVGQEPEQRPHPLAGRSRPNRRARGGSGPSRTARASTGSRSWTRRTISASVSAMSSRGRAPGSGRRHRAASVAGRWANVFGPGSTIGPWRFGYRERMRPILDDTSPDGLRAAIVADMIASRTSNMDVPLVGEAGARRRMGTPAEPTDVRAVVAWERSS